jgi:DNA-binding transcriptional ArsR family regulator
MTDDIRVPTQDPAAVSLARIFRAMAGESRLYVLKTLHENNGSLSVLELQDKLKNSVSRSDVSYILKQLKDDDMVSYESEGKNHMYSLTPLASQLISGILASAADIVKAGGRPR